MQAPKSPTHVPAIAAWGLPLQSVLRIIVSLLFLSHGLVKLFGFPGGAKPGVVPLVGLLGAAALSELIGGAAVLLGLYTRPIAFLLAGEMAVAYFMAHAPQSFFPVLNGGEAAILYCFSFLFFAASGAGPWSVDALRNRN